MAELDLKAGPPEWVHLLPLGEIAAVDGRRWKMSDPAAMITASLPKAESGLVIDFDHQTDYTKKTGGRAPAAGWIRELAVRDGFIVGRVEWTPGGAAALANKEHRFISPVFLYDKAGNITRLLRAGLTNDPAIGTLPAVASASSQADAAALLNRLNQVLGISDGGDAETAIARVSELVNGAPDAEKFIPRDQVQALLSEASATVARVRDETVGRKVSDAIKAGKLPPALTDWATALCRSNEESFDQFVEKMAPIVGPANLTGPHPGATSAVPRSPEALAVCRALGVSPEALAKNLPK